MHLVPQTHWLDPVVYRQKMLETVTAALPRQIKIVALNLAQGTASSYWLVGGPHLSKVTPATTASI